MGLVPRVLYFLRNGTEAPKTPGTRCVEKLTRGGMPGVVNAISFRSFTVARNLVLSIPGYHLGLTAHHQATHLRAKVYTHACFRVIPDRYIFEISTARTSVVGRSTGAASR
jgi:hypothetical protein